MCSVEQGRRQREWTDAGKMEQDVRGSDENWRGAGSSEPVAKKMQDRNGLVKKKLQIQGYCGDRFPQKKSQCAIQVC